MNLTMPNVASFINGAGCCCKLPHDHFHQLMRCTSRAMQKYLLIELEILEEARYASKQNQTSRFYFYTNKS